MIPAWEKPHRRTSVRPESKKNIAAILAEFSDSACTTTGVDKTSVKKNRLRIEKMGDIKNLKDTSVLMI